MAETNNTGETISSVVLDGLPTVEIPKDFQQDKHGYLIFKIATTEGDVQVSTWHWAFSCKGTPGALVACGLLQADWLPGIPGNNSVRQTVAFNDGHATPLRGRRNGARTPGQSIIISRLSRVKYEVRVPTTKEQQEFIQGIQESRERKFKEAKEKEAAAAYAYKPESPGEFRHDWLRMVDISMQLRQERTPECGFSFNKESTERIVRAFSELRRAIVEAGVQAKPALHRDGNVVYLGTQPTGGT